MLPGAGSLPRIAWVPILAVAGIVLAALLAVSGRYGYHRDELYFIQAGGHLALGYPDQPLLTPVLAWTMNALAPRSLLALRIPAALAGVASIVSAGLIAREAGGGRRAQAIAASCCAAALVVLATSHFLTTETLDLAFSSVVCWLLVRLLRTEDERLWVVAGAVLGIGLLNKLLVGILAAAVIGSLLVVGPRALLRSRWAAAGAALALLGALPYVAWQLAHGVPQAAVAHSQAQGGEEGGRGGFIPFQLALVGPLLVPVWLAGLVGLLRAEGWRRYRCFAVAYLALVVIMLATSGKAYYIAGFYPLLLGFGSLRGRRLARARRAGAAVAAGGGHRADGRGERVHRPERAAGPRPRGEHRGEARFHRGRDGRLAALRGDRRLRLSTSSRRRPVRVP